MTKIENFTNYLGLNRYQAQSICLTSDFVLVKMYTILYGFVGLSCCLIGLCLFLFHRNKQSMLRIAIVLLKDPWIIQMFGLLFIAIGAEFISTAFTVHYAAYYLDIVILCTSAGMSGYTLIRLIGFLLDRHTQETFLDALVPVADYSQFTTGPETQGLKHLSHFDNPKIDSKEATLRKSKSVFPEINHGE